MSCIFRNRYWLLGDGADEEAKRWVSDDEHKDIVYSSPRAVEMEEYGNYLSPELRVPPKGFVVVSISHNESDPYSTTLGVSHWGGDGGWIEPKRRQDETGKILTEQAYLDELASNGATGVSTTANSSADDAENSEQHADSILAEKDFLEALRACNNE